MYSSTFLLINFLIVFIHISFFSKGVYWNKSWFLLLKTHEFQTEWISNTDYFCEFLYDKSQLLYKLLLQLLDVPNYWDIWIGYLGIV